jgi:ribosomal protein S18 acetylase RimI-like enzyme
MELGHAVHTAMLLDGQLVAVAGYWHQQHVLRFTLAGAWQILRFYGLIAGIRVIVRGLRLETIVKPPKKHIAYLGHFGVSPHIQGQGLGTMLIDELIRQAQNDGFDTFALDVSSANPRAQKLYERLGFVVKKINPANFKTPFGAIVEHRYMEKSAHNQSIGNR